MKSIVEPTDPSTPPLQEEILTGSLEERVFHSAPECLTHLQVSKTPIAVHQQNQEAPGPRLLHRTPAAGRVTVRALSLPIVWTQTWSTSFLSAARQARRLPPIVIRPEARAD